MAVESTRSESSYGGIIYDQNGLAVKKVLNAVFGRMVAHTAESRDPKSLGEIGREAAVGRIVLPGFTGFGLSALFLLGFDRASLRVLPVDVDFMGNPLMVEFLRREPSMTGEFVRVVTNGAAVVSRRIYPSDPRMLPLGRVAINGLYIQVNQMIGEGIAAQGLVYRTTNTSDDHGGIYTSSFDTNVE